MKRAEAFTSIIVMTLGLSIFLASLSVSQSPAKETNGIPAGWSDDVNLSNDPVYRDNLPEITINGNNIHVVWLHNYQDVFYSKSINAGRTWSSPINLFHSTLSADNPYISVSNNIVHVVWSHWNATSGLRQVLYRMSTDSGETWNPPKPIFNTTNFDSITWGIYTHESNVHIISEDFRDGTNGEIYYRRSIDNGITFDNGQGIDEDRRLTFNLTVKTGMRINGDGSNISIVWSDERDGDWEIYWMISKDNGYTWENGVGVLNDGRKLTNNTSDDINPTVAVNGTNIHIAWVEMSWPGPEYKLFYRKSTDNGVTWINPTFITGPWSVITKIGLDVNGDNVHMVWGDKRIDSVHDQIFYKNSTDSGITWSSDIQLTFNLTLDCLHPKIIVDNETKHTVWYNVFPPDNDREIYYKRSPDFPDTTPPSHTNETPLPDSYKDAPGTNVSVHVTDPSGVNATTIQLWINGSLVSHTSTPITDGYNVSWVSGGFGPGVVTCRIVADDNLGNRLDYTWNFTVLATYNVPLTLGWNLVSLPLEQVDTSPQTILDSIDGQYDVVKYYNCIDTADHWKTYRPGSSVNDLTSIDNKMGIWVHATQFCDLTVHGLIPTSTQINMYAGWNLVGYPSQTTDTVANVLWGTGADRVEVFDPASPYIKEVGATYVMKPGEGYWIHVPADTTWTVTW